MSATRMPRAGLALIAGLVLLAGCGDSGESDVEAEAPAEGVGALVGESTAQLANCGDWVSGSEEDRYATIEDIRGQLTPQNSETAESDLSDEAAYEMFEHTCEPEWAASLRLYKLYAHAQPFASFSGDG
jgi:hypothetical protein